MTVRDILTMTNSYTDVKIYHKGNYFTISGSAEKLLKSADFILDRKVKELGVQGGNSLINSNTCLTIILDCGGE